jgi:LCP family protein required for cell wall assembly
MTMHEPINLLEPQDLEIDEPKPKRKKLFWLFFIIVGLLFLVGCNTYRSYSLAKWSDDPANYDLKTLQPKNVGILQTVKNFIFHADNVLEGQKDDRINILLLGIGGAGHDGPYLSDTNIILSIKPSTSEVAMISIPRDLGVTIGNHGVRKINSADSFGEAEKAGAGGEYARQIFEKTFGMDIPYYARVDFTAFQEIIDEVGGVTIDVPRSFVDYEFPGPNFSYRTLTFTAGTQVMKGDRALDFARSRHGNNGEGSDFSRSRRQQLMISALKEKLLSVGTYTNPVRVQGILQSLSSHITTNLNFGQMMYLANLAKDADKNIKMLVLDNSETGLLKSYIADSGAYILAPRSNNFDNINLAIQNVFDSNQVKIAQNMSVENKSIFPTGKIQILNGTWRAGLAAKYQQELQEKGFSTLPAANSPKRPIDMTTIYVVNSKISNDIILALQKEITAQVVKGLPEWLKNGSTNTNSSTEQENPNLRFNTEADILIILGSELNVNKQ